MGTNKSEGKRRMEEMEDELQEDEEYYNFEEDTILVSGFDEIGKGIDNISNYNKKGKKGAAAEAACQVEACTAEMSLVKPYYRRHKVCEVHARATVVPVAGLHQRFCQQCSRFHDLSEFDESKRSCRRRLAGHNERRRKSS